MKFPFTQISLQSLYLVRCPDLSFKYDGDPENIGKPRHDWHLVQPSYDRHAYNSGSSYSADADHPPPVE